MNGIEALIAMQKGQIVQERISGLRYKIENGVVVRSIGEDGWTECNLGLNLWLKRRFYDSSYNLTFFEAMNAIRSGKKVRSEASEDIFYYLSSDGQLKLNDGTEYPANFSEKEVIAKWTVVE